MRLLIIGALEGQLSEATKLAMQGGAKVAHAASIDIAMASLRAGVGREQAHEAIKEHAVAVALAMRETGQSDNDLFARLAADERLGLDRVLLDGLLDEPMAFVGNAVAQTDTFCRQVAALAERYPSGAMYQPGSIL